VYHNRRKNLSPFVDFFCLAMSDQPRPLVSRWRNYDHRRIEDHPANSPAARPNQGEFWNKRAIPCKGRRASRQLWSQENRVEKLGEIFWGFSEEEKGRTCANKPCLEVSKLHGNDVRCSQALRSLNQGEFNFLTFVQGLIAFRLYG
jgi:hypothetical protein